MSVNKEKKTTETPKKNRERSQRLEEAFLLRVAYSVFPPLFSLLLLLCSYLDIGHVVLYVLHIVSSILIGLVGHHQVVQEVLFYIFLWSLIWSGLARLLMDVLFWAWLLYRLLSMGCLWWKAWCEIGFVMETVVVVVSEELAVGLLEADVVHLILWHCSPALVKVWDLDTSHWSDLFVGKEAEILVSTVGYGFDTAPLAASLLTARLKALGSSVDASLGVQGHFCLTILIVGCQSSLLEIFQLASYLWRDVIPLTWPHLWLRALVRRLLVLNQRRQASHSCWLSLLLKTFDFCESILRFTGLCSFVESVCRSRFSTSIQVLLRILAS